MEACSAPTNIPSDKIAQHTVDMQHAIAAMLIESQAMQGIVYLVSLFRLADECTHACTWETIHSHQLTSITMNSQYLFISVIAAVVSACGHATAAAVFASQSDAIQRVWSILSADQHVLATQNIQEILLADEQSFCLQTCSPAVQIASIGWYFKLSVLAIQAVDNALISLNSESFHLLSRMPANPSAAERAATSLKRANALHALLKLSSFSVGASVVSAVVTPVLLPALLSTLNTNPSDIPFAQASLQLIYGCLLHQDMSSQWLLAMKGSFVYERTNISEVGEEKVGTSLMSQIYETITFISSHFNPMTTTLSASERPTKENEKHILELCDFIVSAVRPVAKGDLSACWSLVLSVASNTDPSTVIPQSSQKFTEALLPSVTLAMSKTTTWLQLLKGQSPLWDSLQTTAIASSMTMLPICIQASINVLQYSIELAKSGAGWAVEPSACTAGYDQSKLQTSFATTNKPAKQQEGSQASDENGKEMTVNVEPEQTTIVGAGSSTDRAARLHQTILQALHLLSTCLTTIKQANNTSCIHALVLVDVICEVAAYANTCLGTQRIGDVGGVARRLTLLSIQILQHYEPREHHSNGALGTYLIQQATQIPRLFASNMALLAALVGGVDSNFYKFSLLEKTDVNGLLSYINRRKQWEHFLVTLPVVATHAKHTLRVLPFAPKLHALSALSNKNTNERKEYLLFNMNMQNKPMGGAIAEWEPSSHPSYPLPHMLQTARHAPITCILQAMTSCNIDAFNMALKLCVTLVGLSPKVGDTLMGPLIKSFQHKCLFYLIYTSQPLTRITDAAPVVLERLKEPLELQQLSSEICRFLLFFDKICLDDRCCVLLCAHGLIYALFAALHCLRHEVVCLALQAMTTTYRTLMRIITSIELQCKQFDIILEAEEDPSVGGGQPSSEKSEMKHYLQNMKQHLLSLSKGIVDALSELLPSIASRFQAPLALPSTGGGAQIGDVPLVLQQIAFILPLLSYQHSKAFLDNLGYGMTVEVFCIKLWLHVEETFQTLVEATEVVKCLLSSDGSSVSTAETPMQAMVSPSSPEALAVLGDDAGRSHVRQALAQTAAAIAALRYILDLVVLAYSRGWISLIVLQRSMRSSLVDAKHVITAYQRAYMILANERPSIEAARTAWLLRHAAHTNIPKKQNPLSSFTEDIGKLSSASTAAAPILSATYSNSSDGVRNDSLEDEDARNALILTALAHIKDAVVTSRQYFGTQIDRQPLQDRFAGSATTGEDIDFQHPFGKLENVPDVDLKMPTETTPVDSAQMPFSRAASALWAAHTMVHSMPCIFTQATDDVLHRALRVPLVEGDDRRVCIFNTLNASNNDVTASTLIENRGAFIRLKALSTATDPTGPARRLARRQQREKDREAQVAQQTREKRKRMEEKAGT